MNDNDVISAITMITAVVGAVCGIAGLVLGIINTWREAQRNRVRLKIVPELVFTVSDVVERAFNFQIEVINLSEFPVVVSEIGFQCRDNSHLIPTGSSVYNRTYSTPLPCRLEPHASCAQFYFLDKAVMSQQPQLGNVNGAYARTQCGALVTGTSSALQQMIKGLGHGD